MRRVARLDLEDDACKPVNIAESEDLVCDFLGGTDIEGHAGQGPSAGTLVVCSPSDTWQSPGT